MCKHENFFDIKHSTNNDKRKNSPEWKLFVVRVENTSGVIVNQLEDRMQRWQWSVGISSDGLHTEYIAPIIYSLLQYHISVSETTTLVGSAVFWMMDGNVSDVKHFRK